MKRKGTGSRPVALVGLGIPRAFQSQVVARLFRGQYSHCSAERNPNVDALLAEARRKRQPEEPILVHQRNCTGNPDK